MLIGKTILITGVSSAIGKQTAESASRRGADVIGVDCKEPRSKVGEFIEADLSKLSDIERVARALPFRLDAVINLAGVRENATAAKVLMTHFYGLRKFSEAVAPILREGGVLVNVASILGRTWRDHIPHVTGVVEADGYANPEAVCAEFGITAGNSYTVARQALVLWTFRAAFDPLFKARGVRVNAVSPGPWKAIISCRGDPLWVMNWWTAP